MHAVCLPVDGRGAHGEDECHDEKGEAKASCTFVGMSRVTVCRSSSVVRPPPRRPRLVFSFFEESGNAGWLAAAEV